MPEKTHATGARVLLAEANEISRRVAVAILESLGCRVDATANAVDARQGLDSGNYDLVLLDPALAGEPDAATSEVALRPSARPAPPRRPPVILLTSSGEQSATASGLVASEILAKPFTKAKLVRVIERWTVATSSIPAAGDSKPEPILDPTTLQTLRTFDRPGQPSMIERAFRLYLEEAPTLLACIAQSIEANDAGSLLAAAHKLKSSSASIGALGFAKICQELENCGKRGQIERAAGPAQKLFSDFIGVRQQVEAQCSHGSGAHPA